MENTKHTSFTPPKASSCIRSITKANTLETPYIYSLLPIDGRSAPLPLAQWSNKAYTSLAPTTIGRSAKHYCFTLRPLVLHRVNQYCSDHRPLVLHTSLLYRSAHPPSGKDAPTPRARTLYIYHVTGKGKANRARRASREGHSNKASEHLHTKNEQLTYLQRSPHSPTPRDALRSEAMIYNILSLYLQSIRLLRLPELSATAAGIK